MNHLVKSPHLLSLLGIVALTAVSCSSAPRNSDDAARLGVERTASDNTAIPVERKMVVTKTRDIPTVTSTYRRADINKMKKNDFMAVGFSSHAAENIVRYRKDKGPFTSVDQLREVKEVNPEFLDNIQDKLGVAPTPPQS